MTLRVQGTISINATQAKAEAKAVATELRKVGADATGMATATKEAGAGARVLGAGAASAAGGVDALAAAERRAATEAVNFGQNHAIAAGQIGNLTSQFNDIGVMLAAGQNPLQLAIQQGTQITQVFGGMGARAAVAALGQAFLSMLSPLNLITIGTIAAGAALFQWLTSADGEVQTLDDALQSLADNTEAYADSNARARSSTAELREEFGAAAEEARALFLELSEVQRLRAEGSAGGVADSIRGQVTENSWLTATFTDQGTTARFFDLETSAAGAWREVNKLLDAFRQMDSASSLDETIAAYGVLKDQIKVIADFNGVRSQQEQDAIAAIVRQELELLRLRRESEVAGGQSVDLSELIALQADGVRSVIDAENERLAVAAAQEVIQNQILIFGRDSELVAQNRLAAERELYAAALEAAGATGDKAAQELAAWDAARGFNAEAAGMPGLLSAAAGAAAGIAGNIWNAVTGMIALKNEQAATARYAAMGDDERGKTTDVNEGGRWRGEQARAAANRRAAQLRISNMGSAAGAGTGRSAGGAAAAREERDAVESLIEKLQREIELEREMDPVKREMIRYREQLKDATAAEREQVEALIVQREREKAATEGLQFISEQTGDALVDALMGGADAGERLIDTLKRAVLQALLLGQGPLGGLLGGLFGGTGGLLGAIGLGDVAQLAEGGMVYGAGGPTDDKVPARLSAGEFVVNARATRRHRHMLESINAAPGFAAGGMVGGGAATPIAGGNVTIAPVIDARGSADPAAVEAAAKRGMRQALEEYRRGQLPLDVRRSLEQPNVLRF